MTPDGLITYDSGRQGCWWAAGDDYQRYHDEEWGRPELDDVRLFEKLTLEAFQSGLSWITILRKRENFRAAFSNFDPEVVARFGEQDRARLLADAGIVRNRLKIDATISNAQAFLDLQDRGGRFRDLVWSHRPHDEDRPKTIDFASTGSVAVTPESTALSKALKREGFRFVGPTTMYALMQAMGVVNDHLEGCHVRSVVEAERVAAIRSLG